MNRLSRNAKRLVVPVLLAGALIAVQVAIAAAPTVSFTPTAPPGGCGLFTLTSNANDADGDITSTEWDFQTDGTVDATGSPVQTAFGTPGPRSVTLRVTDGIDADGTVDTVSATQTVEVQNTGAPNAAISPSNASPGIGDPVTFSAAGSTDAGPIAEYRWDLDNSGDFETSTGTTPTSPAQTYATTGAKTVLVEVTDSCGAKDTATATVFPQNSLPNAAFTIAPNPANPGATVTFNSAASSDPDGDPTGATLTYEWSLDGDAIFNEAAEGETNARIVTKVYPAARTLTVRLRVTDPQGGTNTETIPLTINRAPVAAFAFNPEAPVINEPVTFNGSDSFDTENTIATYEWDLDGDGTTFEATGVTVQKVYAAPGPVSVGLRVTDEDGGVATIRRTVNVSLTRPTARLAFSPANPLPGQRVTLVSTSAPSATPDAPQLTNTQWDLNYQPTAEFTPDGAGPSLATSFATPGPKTVAVKVTQTGGGFDIASITIPVNAPPVASFNVTGTLRDGDDATLASTSEDPDGSLVKHEWDFDGNGRYEQQGRVVTRELKKGTHVVELRVTDAKGATATTRRTIDIRAQDLRPPSDVQSSVSYIKRKWGIELVNFTVAVPSRTTVTVKCKGRGCPRGTFRKRSGKKKAVLRFTKLKGNLRAGSKISIIFSRPGHITGWDTITHPREQPPHGPQRAVQAEHDGQEAQGLPQRLTHRR